jgi:hypothetical protein
MPNQHPRMAREQRTVEAMIAIYCRGQHQTNSGLCPECAALQDYARQRLEKCPFQQDKTTCAQCSVHCYRPEMRQRVREVMRYAGPRMAYRHPVLTLFHLLDGLRKEPVAPKRPGRLGST